MMFVKLALSLAAVFVVLSAGFAQENLTGIKCIVDGSRAADLDSSIAYRSGHVYFCSPRCATVFKDELRRNKDSKFAIKANHQLVLTGQYIQKSCPVDEGDFRIGESAKIAGTRVGFCCRGCIEQVFELKTLGRQAELIFGNSSFDRAFEKKTEPQTVLGLVDR